ncbi:Protein of unknown function [Alteromonadaceae bacterium Bs31]|nr:Protein of unknown function [Alteromonadaceae bacterium Bs31]
MITKGHFDVALDPQSDTEYQAGRMTIRKTYQGGIEGDSTGQMLSHRTSVEGSAGYVALEFFTGRLEGKTGSFALQHYGLMNKGESSLTVEVVPDSATDELAGLVGEMVINIEAGAHYYVFEYSFLGV